uniref:39S ribosomal protein L54, mitochondrial n=1 Tax=Anopheles maculatus TaxID=74869 RepID=A0A182SQC1_9DIPT
MQVDELKRIVKECLYRHVITPSQLPNKDRPFALVTWHATLEFSVLERTIVESFIEKYALKGPEQTHRDGQYDHLLVEPAKVVSTIDDSTLCALGGSKKKKLGKLGPTVEKKVIPVETDTTRLVSFVCGSNVLKQGEDVKIQPDSEYPEWLWKLHVGAPLTLEEMDPNTKAYWRKLRRMALQRNNKLAKLKKF